MPFSAIISIGGYLILAPLIVLLNAIIGGISYEANPIKLFALGVSAPALITTINPNASITQLRALFEPSAALAQPANQGTLSAGISSFFGGGDRPYAIYVGSFTHQDKIDKILNAINNQTISLHAFATSFTAADGTSYQRIFIVQLFSLKDALDARDKLLKSGLVDEATITLGTKNIAGAAQ